jgi:hypothetical protein
MSRDLFIEALRRGFQATESMKLLHADVSRLAADVYDAAMRVSGERVGIVFSGDGFGPWRVSAKSNGPRVLSHMFSLVPSNAGYPVSLTFPHAAPDGHSCADFAALSAAVEDALARPSTGELMLRLMNP